MAPEVLADQIAALADEGMAACEIAQRLAITEQRVRRIAHRNVVRLARSGPRQIRTDLSSRRYRALERRIAEVRPAEVHVQKPTTRSSASQRIVLASRLSSRLRTACRLPQPELALGHRDHGRSPDPGILHWQVSRRPGAQGNGSASTASLQLNLGT